LKSKFRSIIVQGGKEKNMKLTSLEICAGGGGQALGLEQAGFDHSALVEIDSDACNTLRINRPGWKVFETDLHHFSAKDFIGVDLFAGGVPCPPFSIAGKQLGADDERDLFPEALRLIEECKPRAVMLENVRGFLSPRFREYRHALDLRLSSLGFKVWWNLLNAADFGVPQIRQRLFIVGISAGYSDFFHWPIPYFKTKTVGNTLFRLMQERGWKNAEKWAEGAQRIAPTIVGGSKKHGGPDLGPTRAKTEWTKLGVDGMGLTELAPDVDFLGKPRLTIRMVAKLQGFPDHWQFSGSKTNAYRQVGNALPPPLANAIGIEIAAALQKKRRTSKEFSPPPHYQIELFVE
jgi:DNA (cytosine-5)-methyltransferase 1